MNFSVLVGDVVSVLRRWRRTASTRRWHSAFLAGVRCGEKDAFAVSAECTRLHEENAALRAQTPESPQVCYGDQPMPGLLTPPRRDANAVRVFIGDTEVFDERLLRAAAKVLKAFKPRTMTVKP